MGLLEGMGFVEVRLRVGEEDGAEVGRGEGAQVSKGEVSSFAHTQTFLSSKRVKGSKKHLEGLGSSKCMTDF